MENKEHRSIGPVTGASTVGAATGVLIVWIASLLGVEVPQGVEAAVVVLLTALGGWLVKPGTGKLAA